VTDFPPHTLRDYAFLADGERGAVIGPRGDIAFLCLPRWHDDAVFGSLIGGGGHYAVSPRESRYVWGGHYEDGTLIWRSRWVTTTAEIECREALVFPGSSQTAVILRRIEALSNAAHVRIVLDPRPGFGAHAVDWRNVGPGVWEGAAGGLRFRWSGAPERVRHDAGVVTADISLSEGGRHTLILEASTEALGPLPDGDMLWRETEASWREGAQLAPSLGTADVRRSSAVLRGMTSADGGMVAAATMSLPERSDAGRNYDYRYAWIRDQCYSGVAAAAAEAWPLLDAAVGFVAARLLDDGPELKPAYTVSGGRVPDERSLDLDGYPGGTDKAGNHVNAQFQLDAFGEALLLFAAAVKTGRVDSAHVAAATAAIDAIERRRSDPDAGIWELDPTPWAHSRLICAAGLRRFATECGGAQADRWIALADDLVAEVRRSCVHRTGRWQRASDDERVDASLLLPGLRGAVPADDPQTVATWRAVQRELSDDGYVYRFRHDERPLDVAEGAFLLCGFHLALACLQQGDHLSAMHYFDRNRSASGSPGLFTEEFDVVQRQLRGNFPQAFVHALMIESAVELVKVEPTLTVGKVAS
jgi:GH15 family glucan-1,4-alpha-glucosidase